MNIAMINHNWHTATQVTTTAPPTCKEISISVAIKTSALKHNRSQNAHPLRDRALSGSLRVSLPAENNARSDNKCNINTSPNIGPLKSPKNNNTSPSTNNKVPITKTINTISFFTKPPFPYHNRQGIYLELYIKNTFSKR